MKEFSSVTAMIKNENGEYEGIPALRGVDSYELAVQNGFKGSEEEWLESIIGDGWIGAFQSLEARTVNGKPLSADVELTADDIPLSGTVDMSIAEAISAASAAYLTLIGNVNTEMVEAAFGKYNDDNVVGLGRALAMVANYHSGGEIDIKEKYPTLCKMHNIKDIQMNSVALNEIAQHELTELMTYLSNVEYAYSLLHDYLPLHNISLDQKHCVEEIVLQGGEGDVVTRVSHSGFYNIWTTAFTSFDKKYPESVSDRPAPLTVTTTGTVVQGTVTTGNYKESGYTNPNGWITKTHALLYLTPEDTITIKAGDDVTDNVYVIKILNSYAGSNCISNVASDDDTSKIAFGVTLTPNEVYNFEGPSGYYRIKVPKWIIGGCDVWSATNTTITNVDFSLKFKGETVITTTASSFKTSIESGEYDEIRYIEHGEEILWTRTYELGESDYISNYGSYMSSILFYNSTGAYPLLDNIKPTEEASE